MKRNEGLLPVSGTTAAVTSRAVLANYRQKDREEGTGDVS